MNKGEAMEPQQKCDRSISPGRNPYRDMAVGMCCKMGNSPTDRTNTKHRWFSLQDVCFSPVFVCAIFVQFDCYITNNSREFVSLHSVLRFCLHPRCSCVFFFYSFVASKVYTTCSRTNKIVPLSNLNKYLYNVKSDIKSG